MKKNGSLVLSASCERACSDPFIISINIDELMSPTWTILRFPSCLTSPPLKIDDRGYEDGGMYI